MAAKLLKWVIFAVVLAVWPLAYQNLFYLNVAILILLSAILAMAFNLIMRMGFISLAQGAFMGIGAYTSALLTVRMHLPFVAGFVCAGVLTTVAGYLLGKILFRLRGIYFVLVTFALNEVVRLGFLDWEGLTGGANGIMGIPKPSLAGFVFDTKLKFYYLALAITAASLWIMRRVFLSHPGRAYEAINEAENLAESTGINTTHYKVQAFCISCFFTGIAGSLMGHYISYISPSAYTFWESVNLVIMNVLGGVNALVGPIIGAVILVPLPEFFRAAVEYQRALYGVTLILIVCFLPEGIAGAVARLRRRKEVETIG